MTLATIERRPAPSDRRSASCDTRRGTINLRIEDSDRHLIDRAATIVGKSRTEFMIESAKLHAIDVLLDQRLFTLDSDQHDAFVRALDNPPPAGSKLKALMRRVPAWER